MKYIWILILFFSLGNAHGQIQFEYAEHAPPSRWEAACELPSGYLMAGLYGYRNNLLLLDSDGQYVDSLGFQIDNIRFEPKLVVKENNTYAVMGFGKIEDDSTFFFVKVTFSLDLELQDTLVFSILAKGQVSSLCTSNMYYVSQDTVLFITGGFPKVYGRINPTTKEIYKKNFEIEIPETDIIPRKNKPGYLISGYGLDLLDEDFNHESYHGLFLYTMQTGWAGADVEYITDSTFMFATHYDYPNTNPYSTSAYLDTGTVGVFVGVMTEDFEILNTDTLIMPRETSWTLNPLDQHLLDKSTDSTYLVAGITWPYYGDYRRLFFAKYSNTGERLSYNTLSTTVDYYYKVGIKATSDGGCLFYGVRILGNSFESFVLKVGANGIITGETSIPFATSPIEVYPNPTSDYITFDLAPSSKPLEFTLVDLQGHIVLRQKVNNQESISTSHLPKGMYGYRLLGPDGTVLYSGKMVKE